MSYLKPNTAGVYDIPALNASRQLYIKGRPFEAYINELTGADIFEQQEIDELKLLLQYLNTSGLSSEWIVDNQNKNQDLKTAINSINSYLGVIDSSLNVLNGKTRYVSSVQGDNTAPRVASDFQVTINDREKRNIYLTTGANFISSSNDSTNQATAGNYADNNIYLSSQGGLISSIAHLNRIEGIDSIELTGFGGMGIQSSPNIKIGNKGAQILIGSEDTPELNATNTLIKIGKRTLTKNTETQLRGNIKIVDARFDELSMSQALTWSNLISLIPTAGLPLWVASAILTSAIPNFVYSDLWAMKGNMTKDGDVETAVSPKVKNFTIYDSSVGVDLLPKVTTFLAKGDISETTLIGNIRQQVFNGEILLRNNNIVSTNVNWAITDAMDKVNALKLSNNDVELILGAGAQNSQLRISNTTGGPIRFRSGTNTGLQANAHDAMKIFGDGASTQVVIAGNDAPSGFDSTTKMLVDHQNLDNGIKITKHQEALITRVNHNNVNTPSLTLQPNYTGSTTRTLHLNSSDELMYNGQKVNMGGGSSGGVTYYIPLANDISPPANPPLEQTMTTTYIGQPQRTITQAISANTAYYLADYVTEVFNKAANPILSGVQQLNQYVKWNSQNQVGNMYGRLWYQATAPINNILYNKTYSSPVTTQYATELNGTPILIPGGLYNLVFPKIVFTGIDITPDPGQTAQVSCRLEARPASTGNFSLLYNYGGAAITFNANTFNQTITFQASTFTHNQTTNTPIFHNAIRMVITCANGQIRQTTAGAATNAASYRIEATGATTASIRVMLKDDSATPVVVPYSVTPVLVELDMPIDTPYDIAAFNYSTLSTDVFFIQPTGGFGGHQIQLLFNEGTISHIHTTIAQTGSVSDILASGNIGVSSSVGVYTISNTAPVQNVTVSGNLGLSIANNTAALTNTAPVQSVVAGSGINVVVANNVATISATAQQTSDTSDPVIMEGNSTQRKASWYGSSWTSEQVTTHKHFDIYMSGSSRHIAFATRNSSNASAGIQYSSDWGTIYNEIPATNGRVHREWMSICGTTTGDKIWFVCNGTVGQYPFNQIWATTDLFTTMTLQTAPSEFANNNLVLEMMRCSGDGRYHLITEGSGLSSGSYPRVFKSNNGGSTWTNHNLAFVKGWTRGCAMSSNGQYQFVCVDGTSGGAQADTGCGGVYRSTDYGVTFTRTLLPVNSAQIRRVECNSSGQIVVIADCAETRISYDYGATWISTGIVDTLSASVSSSGSIIWYGMLNGGVRYSLDFGRTFTTGSGSQPAVPWFCIHTNSDGSIVVAGNIGNNRRAQYREAPDNVRALSADSTVGLNLTDSGTGGFTINLPNTFFSYVIFNGTYALVDSFGGYSNNQFRFGNLTWDFTNYNYDIEFTLTQNNAFGGHLLFNWDGLDTSRYIQSYFDKEMFNNNTYVSNQMGPYLFYLQAHSDINFHFKGTLRANRPVVNIPHMLILEGLTTYIRVSNNATNYSAGANSIGYSRTINTCLFTSISTFPNNPFNGSHHLSFWSSNSNYPSFNPNIQVRITRIPKVLV